MVMSRPVIAEIVLRVACQSDIISGKETGETPRFYCARASLTSLESEFSFQHIVHELFILAGVGVIY